MKTYEIKLYTAAGVFIKTIEREYVTSNMTFTGAIQSGIGELSLSMSVNALTATIAPGNVCRVFVYSDNYPNGKNVYTWVCTIREYKVDSGGRAYNFTFLGLQYLLSRAYYAATTPGDYDDTKTGTAGTIIKDVLDKYNALAGFAWFDTTDIDITGTSLSIATNYSRCLDFIKDVAKTKEDYYFYIDGAGAAHFKQKSTTPDHLLTLWANIDSLVIKKDIEDLVNWHRVKYSSGTSAINEDVPSQTAYYISQLLDDQSSKFTDVTTSDAYSDAYLAKYINPTSHTKVYVNSEFIDGDDILDGGIEELTPGDTVTILNSEEVIENLQIYKIKYDIRGVELELESIQTLGFLLSN